MRSASRTAERRCAMTIVVRPARSRNAQLIFRAGEVSLANSQLSRKLRLRTKPVVSQNSADTVRALPVI
jgi:hypothetical protein